MDSVLERASTYEDEELRREGCFPGGSSHAPGCIRCVLEPVVGHRGTRVTWGGRRPARPCERGGELQAAEERRQPARSGNGVRGRAGSWDLRLALHDGAVCPHTSRQARRERALPRLAARPPPAVCGER